MAVPTAKAARRPCPHDVLGWYQWTSMKLVYRPSSSLPRLAWSATFVRDDPTVVVEHGAWVETREDRFFEAVWNGDFAEGRIDDATTLAGSGAWLDGDRLVFTTTTDVDTFLYSIELDDRLIVSNSLVFAMCRAGTGPDPRYPDYLYEFYRFRRLGITRRPRRIPLSNGRKMSLYAYRRFAIDERLDIEHRPALHPDPPGDYDDYLEQLEATVSSVFENAAHPDRLQSFRPLATISRGYDSTAVSALVATHGCREAITFSTDEFDYDDNGAENAERLGLAVRSVGQLDYLRLPGHPEAEFCASNGAGASMPLAGQEDLLEARVLLKANYGDACWSPIPFERERNMRCLFALAMSNSPMNEFRLRVGCQIFDVAGIGAIHCGRIHKIGLSDELKPWSVGGDYDRPIPRRIAEDRGLPRDSFGQEKMFGLHLNASRGSLTDASNRALHEYVEHADIPPRFFAPRRILTMRRVLAPLERILLRLKRKQWSRPYRMLAYPLTILTLRKATDWRRASPYLYAFHWGVEEIKGRYEPIGERVDDQGVEDGVAEGVGRTPVSRRGN